MHKIWLQPFIHERVGYEYHINDHGTSYSQGARMRVITNEKKFLTDAILLDFFEHQQGLQSFVVFNKLFHCLGFRIISTNVIEISLYRTDVHAQWLQMFKKFPK